MRQDELTTTGSTAAFREQYRREHVPARYRGGMHLAFTFGIGGAVLVWSVMQLADERQTRQHHRFFTHEAMALDGPRDLRAVLFPPVLMIFFITAFALPAGLLLAWAASPNVAWLFVATSLGYFLNYELLHMAYHLRPDHPITQWWLIRRLEPLHRAHHDPRLMARRNFNITYPLCDALFGTLQRK